MQKERIFIQDVSMCSFFYFRFVTNKYVTKTKSNIGLSPAYADI